MKTANTALFSKCAPVYLETGMLGVKRQARTAMKKDNQADTPTEDQTGVEVDAGDDLVKVNKTILSCEEYEKIQSKKQEFTSYLRSKSLFGSSKLFRRSTFLIPVSKSDEVDTQLGKLYDEFLELVEDFCTVYDTRVEEAKKRLRTQKVMGEVCDLANDADYPPVEKVRKAFKVAWEWVSYEPASNVSSKIQQRQDETRHKMAMKAADFLKFSLLEAFSQRMNRMVEGLTDDPVTGKRKRMFESMLTSMTDYIKEFDDYDLYEFKELKSLVENCEEILAGKNINLFKVDKEEREETKEKLVEVKKKADSMLEGMKRLVEID